MKKVVLFCALFMSAVAWSQCLPTYDNQCTSGDYISNVTFNTINNSTICSNPSTNNYTDYSGTLSTNLQPSLSYTLSVSPGPSWGQYFVAWIDYNHNGTFDASEFHNIGYAAAATTISTTITLPGVYTAGQTKMRVLCRYGTGALTATDACASPLSFGETEDYGVFLGTPLAEDAGITGFVNPLIPTCQFNDSVSVTLKNYGTDTLTSAIVNWKLNTLNQPPLFWTGSLAPQADMTVFVGLAPYVAGDNLYAWTTNPNGVIENPSGSYNDSSEILGLATGLSGTYTIGGTTPDFTDFASASAALNFAGVCGPVVFDIRSGVYTAQINLNSVIGMNATNTVTFRSEDMHRDSVIVQFSGTGTANNYVVKMAGADYYRFESMTLRNIGTYYATVVNITGGSDYNEFNDCKLQSAGGNSTTSDMAVIFEPSGSLDQFNKFIGNSIIGGSFGAYSYGSSTSSLQEGAEFINNEFVDNYYMGIYFYYSKNVKAIGNRIYGQSTYTNRYGIYAYTTDGACVFSHNSIEANASSSFYYGMYISYSDATSSGKALIANNSVSSGSLGSTGTNYAMYLDYCGFYNIYNNSFDVIGGGTGSRALYIYSGGANNVKNNSLTNHGTGQAAYVIGTFAINEMDYNNFYSNGTNLCYFDVANTATLANWQTASGYDDNSINVNPGYYTAYDLHVCSDSLNGKGTPIAMITDDRDFQMRNASTPDIGSDEFAPLNVPGFLGPDALVCTGQTVTIYAGSPTDTSVWSTGDTTSAFVISSPGTYTVTVNGACGTSYDTITISTSALAYSGYLMADTMSFCTGGSAMLTSNMPASTYSWTGGSTNDTLVVTTGGTYTLNISDACGTGTESVVITENSLPVSSFTTTSSYFTGMFNNTSTGGSLSYMWDFGDGQTSTLMNPTHLYLTVGTFTVTLTVTNPCGTNTITSTITTSPLGLEEVEGLGTIAVYPNPSNGIFQLDLNTTNNVNIAVQVTNVLGESVFVKNIGSVNGTHNDAIDITNAAPGVYYVTILSNNEKVMTSKLVKQ